ncbi:MAG: 16S rRNA (cytosine(1402)-N(4))-methyltransferase RsmH [Bdellovibrionaceae bacterium]|nr:16S rRNA (cytosine(1402)-N(4))-methyltransferase RsmH [Pseudobdellovibrionaceae bacterium]
MSDVHIPVLMNEVLEIFSHITHSPQRLLDGTFGRGGHCTALLQKYPELIAVGVDRDETAHEYAHKTYSDYINSERLRLWKGSYSKYAKSLTDEKFDMILLDLGVSSPQLDSPERGFSFYNDGPLDMRMGKSQITTAAEVINTWPEEQLHEIFMKYGEIRSPYRVVRAILNDRKIKPYETTSELAGLIERVEGWKKKGHHPATQFFMALRLLINQELEDLTDSLPLFIKALNPGGVLAVITFHSLEDRITKTIFKDHMEEGSRLNKKVIVASEQEEKTNPRSRSAKLRGFQKKHPSF